jgi:acetyl esterase/lipase
MTGKATNRANTYRMLTYDPVTYRFGTADGVELLADVYGSGGETPCPVIMYIHGGALMMGSRTHIRPTLVELCRDEGYIAVAMDYRLAPESKLPAILDDLRGAFRWVREEGPALFGADPTRMAAVGNSAGGNLSLLVGHQVMPRVNAIVSYYGYGDVMGPWYSQPDPLHCSTQPAVSREEALAVIQPHPIADDLGDGGRGKFYLYCRQQGCWPREVLDADPAVDPAPYIPFCPERNVTAEYPPTLLLHGNNDTDVPYGLSVSMAAALAQKGVPHEMITIDGGGHGFMGNLADLQVAAAEARVREFLRDYL